MTQTTDDVRIREIKELAPPSHLLREFAISERAASSTYDSRRAIHRILHSMDDRLLRRAHWNVKAAIVMQKGDLSYAQALSRLRRAHDSVRDAIGEDVETRLREVLHVG